ncbi:MAG: YitT family protein [Paludibacteraceae bacterium]|nr:YitT family protein [Paludibacteraceae bacterium]
METGKQYFTTAYWSGLLHEFVAAMHTTKFWKELIMMSLGMMLGAASVYYFLMPSHIIVGTISGLSIVLNTFFGGNADTFSYWVMGINAFLLVMAFLLIGNEFGAKTVYTALILGPFVQLWDRIYPYTNFTHRVIYDQDILIQLSQGRTILDANGNPYLLSRSGEVLEQVKDSVMSAGLGMGDVWFDLVCFVLLLSLCQAFEFRINASTGGLDIIAKIINKYFHFDIGASVTIGGAIICCTAFLINDFRMVVIGLIGTWINGLVIDYLTVNMSNRKRVCIISPEWERIRKYIVDTIRRGCSLYEVVGGYTNTKQIEIQSLLTKDEYADLMKFMRDNKIQAFVTAGNCSEIYGTWLIHKSRYENFMEDLKQRSVEFEQKRQEYMEHRRQYWESKKLKNHKK